MRLEVRRLRYAPDWTGRGAVSLGWGGCCRNGTLDLRCALRQPVQGVEREAGRCRVGRPGPTEHPLGCHCKFGSASNEACCFVPAEIDEHKASGSGFGSKPSVRHDRSAVPCPPHAVLELVAGSALELSDRDALGLRVCDPRTLVDQKAAAVGPVRLERFLSHDLPEATDLLDHA